MNRFQNTRNTPVLSASTQPGPGLRDGFLGFRSQRAQAAVEVLIYLGFFMLVFTSLTVMFLSQVNQDVVLRQQQVSQSLAEQVSSDVEMAVLAGPGFNATYPLPERIGGQTYELLFNDDGYMYVNLTSSNPSASPVMFYFPLSTRRIELACDGALTPDVCPGNAQYSYTGYDGLVHKTWKVDVSDGTLHVEHTLDADGQSVLRVG